MSLLSKGVRMSDRLPVKVQLILLEEAVQRLDLRKEGDLRPAIVLLVGCKLTRTDLGRPLWKWLRRKRNRTLGDRYLQEESLALLVR